jgi:hypothetical protein
MSLDVYSHVMPPDEVASERFLALSHDAELTRAESGIGCYAVTAERGGVRQWV